MNRLPPFSHFLQKRVNMELQNNNSSVGNQDSNVVTITEYTECTQAPPAQNPNIIQGPLRRGRWTEPELMYCLKLIQEYTSGRMRTPDRMLLREILQQTMNTTPVRLYKKLKGHPVLKFVTLTSSVSTNLQDDPFANHDWELQNFPFADILQEVEHQSVELLKAAFFKSIEKE